ncbi:hypothetical protein TNCV_1314411 [Trichonephila clavipes]|nr:hypothetical protein TNCV_1314411 [Trichonephila clavipes]
METSRFPEALKIQSAAVSRKGDVDGIMGQRFHSCNGVKAANLNWFHDQRTSFFVDGILKLVMVSRIFSLICPLGLFGARINGNSFPTNPRSKT